MKPNFLPAVAVDFCPKDGDPAKPPVRLCRPYAAIPKDELLSAAEKRADTGSMQELGERCWFGIGGMEQDYGEARRWLLSAAERGAQDAEYLIAEAYRCGCGTERDYEQYFVWLDRAASHGSWLAMFALAAAYHSGSGAFEGAGPAQDFVQSFAWSLETEKTIRAYWQFYSRPGFVDFGEILTRLVQAYLQITRQLSAHCADGIGTKQDLKEALYWLRRGRRFAVTATGDVNLSVFEEETVALEQRVKEAAGS